MPLALSIGRKNYSTTNTVYKIYPQLIMIKFHFKSKIQTSHFDAIS